MLWDPHATHTIQIWMVTVHKPFGRDALHPCVPCATHRRLLVASCNTCSSSMDIFRPTPCLHHSCPPPCTLVLHLLLPWCPLVDHALLTDLLYPFCLGSLLAPQIASLINPNSDLWSTDPKSNDLCGIVTFSHQHGTLFRTSLIIVVWSYHFNLSTWKKGYLHFK